MKKIKLTRYPLTALAVVVIWTLCLIPIPETPLNQISLIDKWTHLVLFGGLTVIIWAEMLRDDKAYLTIKSRSVDGGLSRYEFEKEITLDEASHLLKLCRGGVIDKRRWLVKSGKHTFEVDEFFGDNAGLVMAEVELSDPRKVKATYPVH